MSNTPPQNFFDNLSDNFLKSLLNKDKKNAETIILDAIKNNISVNDIYVNVFQNTQYQVGELWQCGKISVAQEHFCTAVTQFVMSQLYQYIFKTDKIGKTFISMCVSDELHDMGIKMVTDMAEMSGFDTVYLGANLPTNQIEEAIIDYKADVIGISVTLASHLTTLANLIKYIRASEKAKKVKIIIGGNCLNTIPDFWKKTGADAYDINCQEAVTTLHGLVS